MALGILILLFSLAVFADDSVNTNDPNLYRKDGAMNYDQGDRLKDVDATAGAIIIKDEPVKIPKTKKKSSLKDLPKAGVAEDPKNVTQELKLDEAKPVENTKSKSDESKN